MDKFRVSLYSEYYKCRLGTVPVYSVTALGCRFGVSSHTLYIKGFRLKNKSLILFMKRRS